MTHNATNYKENCVALVTNSPMIPGDAISLQFTHPISVTNNADELSWVARPAKNIHKAERLLVRGSYLVVLGQSASTSTEM
jgi:hypothetical protein